MSAKKVDVLAWIDAAAIAVRMVANGSDTIMKSKTKPVRDAVAELIQAAQNHLSAHSVNATGDAFDKLSADADLRAALSKVKG